MHRPQSSVNTQERHVRSPESTTVIGVVSILPHCFRTADGSRPSDNSSNHPNISENLSLAYARFRIMSNTADLVWNIHNSLTCVCGASPLRRGGTIPAAIPGIHQPLHFGIPRKLEGWTVLSRVHAAHAIRHSSRPFKSRCFPNPFLRPA